MTKSVKTVEAIRARDISVLITRPKAGAERLAQKLSALGVTPIVAPMVEIKPRRDARLPAIEVANSGIDVLIFVSNSAASCGIPALPESVFATAKIFAVGASTAKAIRSVMSNTWPKFGAMEVLVPAGDYNSEALLELDALRAEAIANKQVLIVRGIGGRELLASELSNRGAKVAYFEVYERVKTTDLLRLTLRHHQIECPSIGVVTSVEGLSILAEKISAEKLTTLFDMQILAAGARIAGKVPNYGFTKPPMIADNPTPESIAACLERRIMEKL